MSDPHPLPGSDHVLGGVVGGGAGGHRVHVVTRGTPRAGALPVLLLHGLATSSLLWREVARDVPRGRVVLTPDLVGLGRSERPASPAALAPAAQADALLRLLDRLGHGRVVVAGHEMGGAVAVALAARAPERVAGLALLGAPLHRDVLPLRWHLPFLLPAGTALGGVAGRVPALTRLLLAGALDAGAVAAGTVAAHVDRLARSRGAADAARAGGLADVARAVRAVDPAAVEADWRLVAAAPPPLLLLWGTDDPVLRAPYGRRLAAEAGGGAWVPVAGGGHLLPEQHPERVAEELAAFAAELDGTG